MLRNVPHSCENIRRWGTLLCLKSKIKELKGTPINLETVNRRISLHNINVPESLSLETAKEKLTIT